MIPPMDERSNRLCETCHCCYSGWYCSLNIDRVGNFPPCVYHLTDDEYKELIESRVLDNGPC